MAVMHHALTGLLQVIYNQNRQQTRIRLFEIGRRFLPLADRIDEQPMLAGAVTERCQNSGRRTSGGFYDVKGDVGRCSRARRV